MLTEDERRVLMVLARDAIACVVMGRPPRLDTAALILADASGVFVTIRRQGRLRGCLGTLCNRLGLPGEVVRCAINAATADSRFPPVGCQELRELAIQISVLGPLELIDPVADAFMLGAHGLVVEEGASRGLLLPQVAVEWGWTAEEFLRHTSVKAGLPPDAWREGARVYRFAAEVFGD